MAETSKRRTKKSPTGKPNAQEIAPVRMRDLQCDSLSYRFKVGLDKFDLGAFRSVLKIDASKERDFGVVSTRNSDATDYHGHFEWRLRKKGHEISIEIAYVGTPVKATAGETEPYADNVMQWVGQFFKHEDANARVHSDFEFSAKTVILSWFPLPWRARIPKLEGEAILDGIAVALPSQPDGVARFFLSHIRDSVFVGIESERRIRFADFSLEKELQAERAFADKLIEVKP